MNDVRRTRAQLFFCAALLCPTIASAASTLAQDAAWRRIEAPLALAWPRDHGAHLEHETEWWYATGELTDEAGRAFGFQLTIFRHGLDPRPLRAGESLLRPRQVYAAHLALVNVGAQRTVIAERIRRAGAGLAGADQHELRAFVEGFEIARDGDDHLHLLASDRAAGIGLDLELVPSKPLVLHGQGGVSRKGPEPGNASGYASWTRLATHGTLTIGGRSFAAHGESWFDHEWGTSQLGTGVVGWDWFGLRLDDGRELMIYRLRRADGTATAESAGTLVARDGSVTALAAQDFAIEVLARWKSPRTSGEYPARVRVRIPAQDLELTIDARVADCELDTRSSTGTIYWEGPVAVEGSAAGSGYLEMTGYSGSLERKF